MKQKYFLAVCDILGFSKQVETRSLDELVESSLAWFRRSLNHSVHKSKFPEVIPEFSELESHACVGVAWFSDTILLYTKLDTDEAIRELIATVAWLVFETVLYGENRIRAGIAYGEAFIDVKNSIYVGQPILNAHKLERSQQWAGAALDSCAISRIPQHVRNNLYADWWLVNYPVPMKNGKTMETLAVNWSQGIHDPRWRMRWSKTHELPTTQDKDNQPDICEKYC